MVPRVATYWYLLRPEMCTDRHKSPHSHGVPNLHILHRVSTASFPPSPLSLSLFLSFTPYLSLLSLSWSTSVSVLLLILSLLLFILLPHKRATWFSYDSSYEFSSFLFLYSSCGSSTATELFRVALGTHLWIRERAEMISRTKLRSVKMSASYSISRLFFKITFFVNVMKYILLKIFDQFLYTYLTLSYDRKRKEHLKYADLI